MKGAFLTPLVTKHVGAQRKLLVEELVYRDRRGRLWRVPAGTASNGASTPRLLWPLYPPFGEAYEPATWLHDFVYENAELIDVDGKPIEREEADALLLEASVDGCGFRGRGAVTMHGGVRLGGWLPWRRARRRAKAAAVNANV